MGLYIVKKTIESYGGSIVLEDRKPVTCNENNYIKQYSGAAFSLEFLIDKGE